VLRVKNEAESAEIYISGDIVDDVDSGWIKFWNEDATGYQFPKEIKEQLDVVKGKPLTIYINSYGGSIPAGCAMANMIARHDAPTTAIVDGYCCSIATQIFFSADTCKMPTNAYLMVHKPFTYVNYANADEMRAEADRLDVLQKGLETTYQKKAQDGITNEQISEWVNAEKWFTGNEAAKNFKITLLDPVQTLNCAGSLNKLKSFNFKKIPDILRFKDDGNKNPPSFLVEQQNKQEREKRQIELSMARARGAVI